MTSLILTGLLMASGVVLLLAALSLLRGYVFAVLWAWFVVPVFGLPVLPLAAAMGVSLLVSLLTYQSDAVAKENKNSDHEWVIAKTLVTSVAISLVTLLVGWVIRQFM